MGRLQLTTAKLTKTSVEVHIGAASATVFRSELLAGLDLTDPVSEQDEAVVIRGLRLYRDDMQRLLDEIHSA